MENVKLEMKTSGGIFGGIFWGKKKLHTVQLFIKFGAQEGTRTPTKLLAST
jgi:hypothetical protein